MDNLILLSGNANLKLADDIANCLGKKVNKDNIPTMFANSEFRSRIHDNLRGKDVFIINSGCKNKLKNLSVNDIIFETLILVDACRRSMASTVNIIMPLYPYSRGDKKDEPRAPIPAKMVANLFSSLKIDRLVSLDLHSTQIQGFIDIPFDNLYSQNLIVDKLENELFNTISLKQRQDRYVIVSPDAGATKRTLTFSSRFKLNTIIMHKQRNYVKANTVEKTILIQENGTNDYINKTAIICDDMADTCGTLISAVNSLINYGIKDVICVITHGIFSNNALEKINNCQYIKKIYVSDSIPQDQNLLICRKLEIFSISNLIADVIERIITRKPISELFVF